MYAEGYFRNDFAIFKYDKNEVHEITSDTEHHISRLNVEFERNFCILSDSILRIRHEYAPQLYFFTLEGDFVNRETSPVLKDKEILDFYNDNSMLVRDYETKELWVVKLNGEATKINIDAENPWYACVLLKNLFVYCFETKTAFKYVSS